MDPYTFALIVIVLFGGGAIYLNNKNHALWTAILAKVGIGGAPTTSPTSVTVNHAPVTLSTGNQPTNATDPASSIWTLDPVAAVTMTQSQIANAYYVNYLKSLTKGLLFAWQSAFVQAAAKLVDLTTPAGQGAAGAWLYDPFGTPVAGSAVNVLPGTPGAMVMVTNDAQANLVVLGNLGAPVINGVPGQ
jgi:hypothetical protein